ncbi:MAG: Tol-Pal system protein TolB [Campylobacteraceae bacterium]|jgi:TolB protein|nr:Tol-Pal system protein TolB [Campylobacteraceae bacterium]
MKKLLFIIVFGFTALFAAGDATIEIVKTMDKLPVIQLQDTSSSGVSALLRNNIFKLLVADLKITTYYSVNEAYGVAGWNDSNRVGYGVDTKTDLVLRYRLTEEIDDSVTVNTRLINTRSGSIISERSFKISKASHYPILPHSIIMSVVKDTKQDPVDWMNRYIIFSKNTAPGESEIVISDYTLTFQQTVVKGGLNIFPKWADKDQNSFYYTSNSGKEPIVYKVSLMNGQREEIMRGKGILVVSDVSSDGNRLLLTMSPDEQADIFMYDLRSKSLTRITNYRGVDVSGSFVDDDTKVVFVSDRLGYPNIFSKKLKEDRVEQMVYLGKNNSSASAYKHYIVYSGRDKASEFGQQVFNLYLISTKTDYIRQLTATGKNLFPRFSHDGGSVLFIKDYANESALGIVRLGVNKSFYFPIHVGKIQSLDW